MEILYIVGIFLSFWVLGKFFSWVGDLIDNHKTKIRDQVLLDLQQQASIIGEIEKYKNKLKEINFEREEGFLEAYFKERNIKLVGEIGNYLRNCPACLSGSLVARKGKYGNFIGCTNYPQCKHTENIKKARTEYKSALKSQILADIKKAYS